VHHTYGDFRARREATVWQRLNRILLVLLVIAIWLVIVSLFVPPYKKLMRSRAEVDNLQQQVNEQQNLLARQTREVNLLKTDVTYLEGSRNNLSPRDRARETEAGRHRA
jgi:cell division protein FtsL